MRAATFDVWNTVLDERPGSLREHRLAFWRSELPDVPEHALVEAHDESHRSYEEHWRRGEQFVVRDAVRIVAARLGVADARSVQTLADGFDEGGRRADIRATANIGSCLSQLAEAGVRLGVICDIGLTPSTVVRELLAREGVLDFFDSLQFSDEIGVYKPDPGIFRASLRELQAKAAAAAHIGDRRRTDVAGARGLGMTALRYRAAFDDTGTGPEGHHVVDDFADVPELILA
jgi:putative hydrolase of the HAD superfamily